MCCLAFSIFHLKHLLKILFAMWMFFNSLRIKNVWNLSWVCLEYFIYCTWCCYICMKMVISFFFYFFFFWIESNTIPDLNRFGIDLLNLISWLLKKFITEHASHKQWENFPFFPTKTYNTDWVDDITNIYISCIRNDAK